MSELEFAQTLADMRQQITTLRAKLDNAPDTAITPKELADRYHAVDVQAF